MITIDEYVKINNILPDLIKIDTEGNEINVLKGASEMIKIKNPLIIFESNNAKGKSELQIFFQEMRYLIYDLPFGNRVGNKPLSKESFLNSRSFNFIAAPETYFL